MKKVILLFSLFLFLSLVSCRSLENTEIFVADTPKEPDIVMQPLVCEEKTCPECICEPEEYVCEYKELANYLLSNNKVPTMTNPYSIVHNDDKLIIQFDKPVDLVGNQYMIYIDDSRKSMSPVIDAQTTAIVYKPKSDKEIKIGDIILWEKEYTNIFGIIRKRSMMHRVVKKYYDKGWKYKTMGDNNIKFDSTDENTMEISSNEDPIIIELKDIKYKVVGVLW